LWKQAKISTHIPAFLKIDDIQQLETERKEEETKSKLTEEIKENSGDEKKGNYIFKLENDTHLTNYDICALLFRVTTGINVDIISRATYKFTLVPTSYTIGGEIEIGKEQLLMNFFDDNGQAFYEDNHLCIPIGRNIVPFTLPSKSGGLKPELHLQLAEDDIGKLAEANIFSLKVFSKLNEKKKEDEGDSLMKQRKILQYHSPDLSDLYKDHSEIDLAKLNFYGNSFPSSHLIIYCPLSHRLVDCSLTMTMSTTLSEQKEQEEKKTVAVKTWEPRNCSTQHKEKEKEKLLHDKILESTLLISDIVNIISSYLWPIFSENVVGTHAYILDFSEESLTINPRHIKIENCITFAKCDSAKLKLNFNKPIDDEKISATMTSLGTLGYHNNMIGFGWVQ
jgi:hypothetical protein